MFTFLEKAVIQNILFFYRYFFPDTIQRKIPKYDHPTEKPQPEPELTDLSAVDELTNPFGHMISEAEHLILKELYNEALILYRQIDNSLSGTEDLVRIQFVRDRIEILLNRVTEEPVDPQEDDVINAEDLSAEERFKTTVLEANNYLSHDLYHESFFLYQKLEKEWAKSNDSEKISLIRKKIQMLNELLEDPDRIPFQEEGHDTIIYMDDDGTLKYEEKDPDISKVSRNRLMYEKLFTE